jgi:hypothetical protein
MADIAPLRDRVHVCDIDEVRLRELAAEHDPARLRCTCADIGDPVAA